MNDRFFSNNMNMTIILFRALYANTYIFLIYIYNFASHFPKIIIIYMCA